MEPLKVRMLKAICMFRTRELKEVWGRVHQLSGEVEALYNLLEDAKAKQRKAEQIAGLRNAA